MNPLLSAKQSLANQPRIFNQIDRLLGSSADLVGKATLSNNPYGTPLTNKGHHRLSPFH
ncbi:unnamed protein product [Acidithrix sp. C25]|nr:unnamed protein product [Acidithrix sp. C25]